MPQPINTNALEERFTFCNVCEQKKLCYWVRRGIGNVWMCAECAKTH